jgi:uncharacterized oxidoreductase
MKTSGNTVLITGGASGIGLELAKQFLALSNTVVVTGRDPAKLDDAKNNLPGLHTVQSDGSDPKAIMVLGAKMIDEFPELNIVINNAGIMRKLNLQDKNNNLQDLTREIDINLMGPIRMAQQFLPHLKTKKSAAIVNVSSGLAFVPFPIAPVYSATKAGIHAFTRSLRVQLKNTHVKVFELAPPATETRLFRGDFSAEDLKDVKTMSVETLARHAIEGIERDTLEICPGFSKALKLLSRLAPEAGLKMLGRPVDNMLAETSN